MMHCMAALWTSGELVWIKSSLSWEDGESLGLVSVNWRVCPFHCRMEGKRNRWLEKSCYYLRCHPLLFCFCLFFFFPEYIFWLFLRVLICSSLHWSVSGLSTALPSNYLFWFHCLLSSQTEGHFGMLFFNRKLIIKKEGGKKKAWLLSLLFGFVQGKVGNRTMQQIEGVRPL